MYKQLKVQGDKSLEIHYKKFKNNLCNVIKQAEEILQGYVRQKQKTSYAKCENLNSVINKKTKKNILFSITVKY